MKQRLVGAIVLVALAVIFLPMLLDGSGHSGPHDVAIELPAEPQPPENRLEESGEPDDFTDTGLTSHVQAGDEKAPTGAAGASEREDAGAGEGNATLSDEADSSQGEEPGTAVGSGGDEQPDATSEDAEPDATENVAGDEAEPAPDAEGWVVQVGSFSRETNALVLRDRLREADFEAFAERSDNGERTLWRVRIGPIPTREEADRLGERVAEQRGEPTLVMSHP